MSARLARAVIRLSAGLVPGTLRARWREEWLAELDAEPDERKSLVRTAGAPWDALSSRWTTRGGLQWSMRWRGWLDVRMAWRSLRRAPWYAVTAAGVIALTMTFTTTIFAIVDGVLFKPLPYPASDQLFAVVESTNPATGHPAPATPSPAQLTAWRDALPEAQFAAYAGVRGSQFPLRSGTRADLLSHVMVSPELFQTLGILPAFGQFAPEDFATSTRVPNAIVSYEFWQRWCGGDRAAIGRSIVDDDGAGIRVIGVLPRGFVAPWGYHADVVTPLVSRRGSRDRGVSVVVRVPAGWTGEQVSSRLSAVDAALAPTWPVSTSPSPSLRYRTSPIGDVTLTPIREVLTAKARAASWLVLAAALSLMALGCLNVSGLAAARVQDRWRELVLRRALGARSWDLVRLVAAESAVVVAAGALVGVASATPLLRGTIGLMADPVQFLKIPSVDWRVLTFSAIAAAACVAIITALAARTLRATNAHAALAEGPTTSRRARWSSWSIVSSQVALALVMAVGGALVAGSLLRVWSEDPGLDLTRTARIQLIAPKGASAADIEDLMADLRRLPGIVHAGGVAGGIVDGIQYYGSTFDAPPHIPQPPPGAWPGSIGVRVQSLRVTDGYLQAAGLAVLDGRLPTPEEFGSGAPVLVVSETVARGYWPQQRAIGQTLVSNEYSRGPVRAFTVIGVVPDARYAALDRDPYGAIYYPVAADPRPHIGNALLQLSDDTPTPLAGVEQWLRTRCPRCVLYGEAQTLADLMSASILPRTFHAWLFASFGVASLIIVGVGVLGLVAMTSSRRTREIGIRLALGATAPGVAVQMLRDQIGAVIAGLLAGGLVAAWAVRFVESYLYKLPLYDVPAWTAAVVALFAVTTTGALIPAVRASRVDPVHVLRVE